MNMCGLSRFHPVRSVTVIGVKGPIRSWRAEMGAYHGAPLQNKTAVIDAKQEMVAHTLKFHMAP